MQNRTLKRKTFSLTFKRTQRMVLETPFFFCHQSYLGTWSYVSFLFLNQGGRNVNAVYLYVLESLIAAHSHKPEYNMKATLSS